MGADTGARSPSADTRRMRNAHNGIQDCQCQGHGHAEPSLLQDRTTTPHRLPCAFPRHRALPLRINDAQTHTWLVAETLVTDSGSILVESKTARGVQTWGGVDLIDGVPLQDFLQGRSRYDFCFE